LADGVSAEGASKSCSRGDVDAGLCDYQRSVNEDRWMYGKVRCTRSRSTYPFGVLLHSLSVKRTLLISSKPALYATSVHHLG